MRKVKPAARAVLLCASAAVCASFLRGQVDEPTLQMSHEIFRQLVEINTTDSVGSTTVAAKAMAQRLLDAGFPPADVQVLGPNDRKGNLVARIHGTGAHKPVLLIGHLDVVEARREDWTMDPFKFIEKDGFYYGRGTQDMKDGDAIYITTFIRLKKEGYKPDRDIILALTADEEGGKSNGVAWLIKNHRDLVDAEFVINQDGGGITSQNGAPMFMSMDATEKIYADYQLEVTNPGGHSSLPVPDNAIYQLAGALKRLQDYTFPFELNEVTRSFFERMADAKQDATSADMRAILKNPPDPDAIARLSTNSLYNANMRTTCVPTRLDAGDANNALPQNAQANVNCRILPGHTKEEVRQTLVRIFSDPKVAVRFVANNYQVFDRAPEEKGLPPVRLRPDVMKPLENTVQAMWPGLPVIPTMSTGATDGVYTNAAGMPPFGITGTAIDLGGVRAHGRDERLGVKSFDAGVDFFYRFLKALTSSN